MSEKLESSPSPPISPLLTKDDVADLFKISVESVRRLSKIGRIPAPIRVGGALRWRRSDIDAFLTNLSNQLVTD